MLEVFGKMILIVLALVSFGCGSDVSNAGENCDNNGEVKCGFGCVAMQGDPANICTSVEAVLRCDGYEWQLKQACINGCSCSENSGNPKCQDKNSQICNSGY